MEDIFVVATNCLRSRFRCRQSVLKDNAGSVRVGMRCWDAQSSCQILHRLTSSPESTCVRLRLASCPNLNQDRVSQLAQIWFPSLVRNGGYLLFKMRATASGHLQHQGAISVVHWASEWAVNGSLCDAAPPSLHFDNMAGTICSIEAELYSLNSSELHGHLFAPSCSDIVGVPRIPSEDEYDFAHRGNTSEAAVAGSIYRGCHPLPHGMF